MGIIRGLMGMLSKNVQKGQNSRNENQTAQKDRKLSRDLKENEAFLHQAFYASKNQDFHTRTLFPRSLKQTMKLFYMDGMVDMQAIEEYLIRPLSDSQGNAKDIGTLIDSVPIGGVRMEETLDTLIDDVLNGFCVVLIDGMNQAVVYQVLKMEHRSVDKPQNETVIKGANEGFVESAGVNRGLIRKQLRSEHLVSESIPIGQRKTQKVTIMYLEDLADPKLVRQVREKLEGLQIDIMDGLPVLEQYIEDRPFSLVPTVLYTERPDRAVAFLKEGHVVLLSDSAPACLIVPVTFWSFFHTAEDMYQRWAYGNFIRLIRVMALMIAMLTPSIYIAATNYQMEMIPTDLLLAIAATREIVPFPAVIEVLIMEVAFELLREAGVRVPSPIGPTIGIVGALILGQAAVEANIVSPILVIVVALTGLASFAIPEVSFSYMIRIARFGFLISAAIMGFLGIMVTLTISISYLVSVTSFGVPFLSPKAPYAPSSVDMIIRAPIWMQKLMPTNIHPQKSMRKRGRSGREDEII